MGSRRGLVVLRACHRPRLVTDREPFEDVLVIVDDIRRQILDERSGDGVLTDAQFPLVGSLIRQQAPHALIVDLVVAQLHFEADLCRNRHELRDLLNVHWMYIAMALGKPWDWESAKAGGFRGPQEFVSGVSAVCRLRVVRFHGAAGAAG